MHISEGVLAAPVIIAGAASAAAGCGIGLRKMDFDKTPRAAVLASSFFAASLIHVPLGPTSIHLVLNGLMGVILGWASFPAILVALLLQAILLQFGGLTTLGVNCFAMAFPSLLCFLLLGPVIRGKNDLIAIIGAFVAGSLGILLSGLIIAGALALSGEQFIIAARLVLIAHVPVIIIEGFIVAMVVAFLRRVKPDLLKGVT